MCSACPDNCQGDVMLPREVIDLLAGMPAVDRWEPVFPLLTTDPDGEPRVCLLSGAEIEADRAVVRCAVRSRRTSANLRRSGRALLHVVGQNTSYYVRCRVNQVVAGQDGLAVAMSVVEVERDTLGIPLQPMRFHASEDLAAAEHWGGNVTLFAQLTSTAGGPDDQSAIP